MERLIHMANPLNVRGLWASAVSIPRMHYPLSWSPRFHGIIEQGLSTNIRRTV